MISVDASALDYLASRFLCPDDLERAVVDARVTAHRVVLNKNPRSPNAIVCRACGRNLLKKPHRSGCLAPDLDQRLHMETFRRHHDGQLDSITRGRTRIVIRSVAELLAERGAPPVSDESKLASCGHIEQRFQDRMLPCATCYRGHYIDVPLPMEPRPFFRDWSEISVMRIASVGFRREFVMVPTAGCKMRSVFGWEDLVMRYGVWVSAREVQS